MRLSHLKRLWLCVCGIVCVLASVMGGELRSARFDNFTQKNGLSNDMIQCITQDSIGFIWVGTSHGLHRFDGYSFYIYNPLETPNDKIRGELIRSVYQDRKGRIFVGTENGGMYAFDSARDSFIYIPLKGQTTEKYSANDIAEDNDGRIWVGTDDGIAELNAEQTALSYHHFQSDDFSGIVLIKRFCTDAYGRIWIGTADGGLYLFNPQKDLIESIRIPEAGGKAEIRAICTGRDSTVWVGTYHKGVYTISLKDTSKIEPTHITTLPTSGAEASVKAVLEDKDGYIWVGTRQGLIQYDRKNEKYIINQSDAHDENSIVNSSVIDLLSDKKGDLWVGTRGGLSYMNQEKQVFEILKESKNDNKYLNSAQVYAFKETDDHTIWIGTEGGGINIYDTETRKFRYITPDHNGLSTHCIKSLEEYNGKMLVGTYMGGLNIVDIKTGKVEKVYTHNDNNPKSIRNNNVWHILRLKGEDKFILSTSSGLDLLDAKTWTITHIDNIAYEKEVWMTFEDSDGDLWAFTPDEILIRQRAQDRTITHTERARSIVEGEKETFYVGSLERGVVIYNKYSGAIRNIKEEQGLVNCSVHSLAMRDSILWVGTARGLSAMNINSGEIKNYDERDGLQSGQFHYGASVFNSKGELMIGGNGGANIFNPANLKTNTFMPSVVINEIKVFNSLLSASECSYDEESGLRQVYMDYDKNMFSAKFASLSYSKTEKNQYKYRLLGLDNRWVEAGTENRCTYTNLEPGDYTLEVLGSNCDGVWTDKSWKVLLTVRPPFWKTWWFRLLAGLSLLTIVGIYMWSYRKRIRLHSALDMEKKKATEMEKVERLKIDFFTNISHELRTPLTLILGPISNILRDSSVSGKTREMAELAQKNANQLLRLVNQVLDFKKVESGTMSVKMKSGDIRSFVQSVVRSFEPNAESRGVKLSFDAEESEDLRLLMFDGDKMEKIVNNLVSNSLKFTPQGGMIRVGVNKAEQHHFENGTIANAYIISCTDTGRGISKEDQSHIFERFYQSDTTTAFLGTGIGLSLLKDFVKLMEGDVKLESELNKGTKVTIILPIIKPEQEEKTEEKPIEAERQQTEAKAEASEDETEEEIKDADKPVMLIAEDNDELRTFCAEIFGQTYTVVLAKNGAEALKKAEESVPDIVVTDLLMPEMCGDELCKKLKGDERTSHIPVLLLTAVHSKETEIEVLKCGADDFLTKPFDIDILNQKIENLFRLRNSMKKRFKIEQIIEPKNVTVQSPDEKFMQRAMQVIEKNIADPDFDIEQFARDTGVSRMQLYRKMNALTGMTVKEFIRNIRIKRAKQLLEQGALTVSEVAYTVGFKDIAYFRKCFRAQVGVNPSEIGKKEE